MQTAYAVFAKALMATCPADFQEARIVAEVGDDWSDVRYDCMASGQETKGLKGNTQITSDVDDALRELRRTWPNGPLWSRCTFTLHPDGRFKFDVSYDDAPAAS